MTRLFLWYVHRSGTIPTVIGKLSQLQRFQVGSNKLIGAIPEEIYSLEKLTHVHLMENKLQDDISSQIGKLSLLEQLQLHRNSFSGGLPTEFGMLGNLQTLTLHYNIFSNEKVPVELCNLRDSSPGTFTVLTSDCLSFPGNVQCDCCSTCYCNDPDANACLVVGPDIEDEIAGVLKERSWMDGH